MNAKAQAVEQRAGAEHAVVPGKPARQVGERIGRIGDDKKHRGRRRGLTILGTMSLNTPTLVSSSLRRPSRSLRSAALAAFLIDPGSKHHEVGTGEIRVVAIGVLARLGQSGAP